MGARKRKEDDDAYQPPTPETRPSKKRLFQRASQTPVSKSAKQTKQPAKPTQKVVRRTEVEVIDLEPDEPKHAPQYELKTTVGPVRGFPRYSDANVYIQLDGTSDIYTYALNANVLARHSSWFRDQLNQSWTDLDDRLVTSSRSSIRFRFEMVKSLEYDVDVLERTVSRIVLQDGIS